MDEGLENRLLECILGIFSILCDSGECEENTPGVAIAKLNECPFVSCLRRRKKHFFLRRGFHNFGRAFQLCSPISLANRTVSLRWARSLMKSVFKGIDFPSIQWSICGHPVRDRPIFR